MEEQEEKRTESGTPPPAPVPDGPNVGDGTEGPEPAASELSVPESPQPAESPQSLESPQPAESTTAEGDRTDEAKGPDSAVPSPLASEEENAVSPTVSAEGEAVDLAEETSEEPISDSSEGQDEETDPTADGSSGDEEDKPGKRRDVPMQEYHTMGMDNLVGELQRLVKNERVQAIGKHVNAIKAAFDAKFRQEYEARKEEFVTGGGNEIDFRYSSVAKRQFNEVFAEYREKRDQHYKDLETNLQQNLVKRHGIIEELKGLVNVEEDINTIYKQFKDLQERWRNAGPVPRTQYNDVWRTYHHHIEIFYDFLHLNRELRDLDFKHNLEAKMKLVERAESLVAEPDLNKAFQELQTLHKVWKEDIGPVAPDQREPIWERFSNATKAMHQRRQEQQKKLDLQYEANLLRKNELISEIEGIASVTATDHKTLQQQVKQVESLRETFFKIGKVPQKVSDETWSRFKEAVRLFNRSKNKFYKGLKQEQNDNLRKKRALLERALALKDSEDRETATPEMKRIQSEWKQIGHVPRKHSDAIWKEFREACNAYFDRLNSSRNASQKAESANLEKKNAILDRLKGFQLSGNREKDLPQIKAFIGEWKEIGHVPQNRKQVNTKFNKIIDALFAKLDIDKQESELLRYGDKLDQLAHSDNADALQRERTFIRRKIDESNAEIRQLENNLQFFKHTAPDNPMVQDVRKNIDRHREALDTWKAKLKSLNIMGHQIAKEAEKAAENDADPEGGGDSSSESAES